jgi:hypothetical protein
MENTFQIMGKTRANTVRIQLTDSSQLLSAAVEAALGASVYWAGIRAALISCEDHDARIAFGASASTTVGHVLYAGQPLRIPSNDMVAGARVINSVSGQTAVIQVTLEY